MGISSMRERWAAARRQMEGVELPDVPVTRERFRVDVEQNHGTAGMGNMNTFKWRWSVIDTANDRVQASSYSFTRNMAQTEGNLYIKKIVTGKRPVK